MQYFGNLAHIVDKYFDVSKLVNGVVDELILDKTKVEPNDVNSNNLVKAGYDGFIWKGISYYPNIHFSKQLIYELDSIFNTKALACWINEIPVGKVFPPHVDFEPRMEKIKHLGKLVNYNIHLGKPNFGHVFFIKDVAHYMQNHGDCYSWDPNTVHSAANVGFEPKYNLIYNGIELYEPININYLWDYVDDSLGDCKDYCINWDYKI